MPVSSELAMIPEGSSYLARMAKQKVNNERENACISNSWIFKCWHAIDFVVHILHKFHNWLACALLSDIYITIKTLYLDKPVAEICLYLYSNKMRDTDTTPTPNAKTRNRMTRKFHSARRKKRKTPPYAKSKKEVSTVTTEDADFQIVVTSDEARNI